MSRRFTGNSTPESNRPHAALAQQLRVAALVAISQEREASRLRRRARRAWCAAVLAASASIAGVFQSCAGSKQGAATSPVKTGDAPLLHSARQDRKKLHAGDEHAPGGGASIFDAGATDLQKMFDGMGTEAAADAPAAPTVPPTTPRPLNASHGQTGMDASDSAPPPLPRGRAEPYLATPDEINSRPTSTATPAAGPAQVFGPTVEPAHHPLHPETEARSLTIFGPPAPPAALEPTASAPERGPLGLGTVALCERVESFGRYTPLGGNRFLGGRTNAAIVYAELENFTQQLSGDETDTLSAELSIQVELFHDDGSRQWRSGEASIHDRSRTRRRDFFVVQRIDLPANLSLGKYNLKITIRDRLAPGGGEVENILPIQIVADAGLLLTPDVLRPTTRPRASRLNPGAPFAGPEPLRSLVQAAAASSPSKPR